MNIFNKRPFLIGEIGVNFYDIAKKENITPMDAAKLMIKEAKNAGIDAVKFQTYKAEKIASRNSPAYWDLDEEPTTSQFELFKKFDTFGPEEYRELAEYCREVGIMFLSTPFDFEAIDFLDDLMDVYKISSSDLTNIPFIKAIALKNKPIILSTGASTLKEIKEAVNAIEEVSNVDIGLMHCVLSYPTKDEDANLLMIKDIKEQFEGYDIGYSDHTKPDDKMLILTTAYLYGANIIEKHFTLDKTLTGNDHYHAMDVEDVKTFNENIELINKIKGKKVKQPLVCESLSRKEARRSIVASKDIKKGEEITRDNITFKRPGTGISPSKVDEIIGMNANEDITEDTLLTYEMLE
ncbi:N,N'-diacetyllegionaminic acid synthase [Methanobrevibacter woesei]|uniref:N,N'-diacetyllegionaminic acid synthase n=1 Tax=Methanobrevibacter woesei TaxID=190976 RepID=A0A2U1S741_9EURY|nr:N-acetylneuraminate synthase family protein [Methanobrevibacter woesei]MCC9261064.1 N-acetylneuraminate synthase family protein [Methanobrevibacter woesei]PWB85884.1 N,N'-diacetyllegionaminic acid synthase [Methanobrevibacter woesei]